MIIAHGHQEEFFNSLLPIQGKDADPILKHPWGYYMARLYYDWTASAPIEETSSNPNMFEKAMFKILDLGFDTRMLHLSSNNNSSCGACLGILLCQS